MDWTMGTFGTVGNDLLDAGDYLADFWDSWYRRRQPVPKVPGIPTVPANIND